MNGKTNGATIIVESTGAEYHTLATWGLAIGNNNIIGNPVQETNYIEVMGRPGPPLDLSEAMTGRPIFKTRPFHMELGGIRDRYKWTSVISDWRNKIEGRVVRVIMDDDPSYYYTGRAHIIDFDRAQRLGTFALEIENCDAYKYCVGSSTEDIPWDLVDFEETYFDYIGTITVENSYQLTIPAGKDPVVPVINVTSITSETLKVKSNANNVTHQLSVGRNRFPDYFVNGSAAVKLTFTGSGVLEVDYRGRSL